MEEGYFADDSSFEAVELAEDELIDAYVRNELSPDEQRQFKTKLLSSARIKERVNFARTLAEKADSLPASESEALLEPAVVYGSPPSESKTRWWERFFVAQPAFGMAMATCALLILVTSVVLVSGWWRLRKESEHLAAERSALQRRQEELNKQSADQKTSTEQSRAELKRATDQLAEDKRRFEESLRTQKPEAASQSILGAVSSILLRPGSVRSSGGRQELALGPRTSTAELKLELPNNDYGSYAVTVTTPGGDVVERKSGLRPRKSKQGPLLILSIPARRLAPGDYIVNVNGVTSSGAIDPVSDYEFRITAKQK
jgi:hypothetical protein